jgi:hypothetical protein
MDWHAWHDTYETSDSQHTRRLRTVTEKIRSTLDAAPPGPIRVVSVCAGQGRDLLGALADHPRRADVSARLVELDPRNTSAARETAAALGLPGVEAVTGDASLTDTYSGAVPAQLVLVVGVFGNLTPADIEHTTDFLGGLCAPGATVIWSRNRKSPDLFPRVCDWLEQRGFDRVWVSEPDVVQGIGVHRFTGEPRPLPPGERMFTFVGYDVLNNR